MTAGPFSAPVILMLPLRPLLFPLFLVFTAVPACAADKANVGLVVLGDYVVTMDASMTVIEQGAVAIDGNQIVAVDTAVAIEKEYRADRVLLGDGKVVLPGLINGHTHSAMTLLRGLADDLALMAWLNGTIFPVEGALVEPEFIRIGSELACLEMIQGGTTSFVDMYFHPEVIAGVVERCGLRAVIAAPHIDVPSPGYKGWDDSFAAAVTFVEEWQGRHPRITPAFAPHAPYTVSPEHYAATAREAARLKAPVTTHIAEAPAEVADIDKRFDTTSLQLLDSTGLLDGQLIGAHMVHLSDQDVSLAAAKGVGAIHNPTSNLKLAAGIARVPYMIDAGVNVGLGTDGAASNNDLDLWEEIRLTALIHKQAQMDPTVTPAAQVLQMATSMGAAAVGLDAITGRLEPGLQADLIQVDFSKARQQPVYNIVSHLVYVLDSQDVTTTIVDGEILMLDRRVLSIDEEALQRDVARMRESILVQRSTAD